MLGLTLNILACVVCYILTRRHLEIQKYRKHSKKCKQFKSNLEELSECKKRQDALRALSIAGHKDAGKSLSFEFELEKKIRKALDKEFKN